MPYSLDPLPEPHAPEIERLLASYPRREGYLLQLFRVFANSERFLKKGVANLLDRESPLTMRQREIVILRTTAQCGCEYEWGVHVAGFAKHVGLTEAQVQATTCTAALDDVWSREERCLIRVVDALGHQANLPQELLKEFQQWWNQAQQLEIIALCGNYRTVSYVANVAGLEAEPFAARFPV